VHKHPVLIVDDDPLFLDEIQRLLTAHEGGDIMVAATGGQALQIMTLMGTGPLMVLLDLGLPDQDGLDVLAEISLRAQTGMVIVTASGDPDARHLALSLGADAYLRKPFEPDELLLTLDAVARRVFAAGTAPHARRPWRYNPRDWSLIAPDGSVLPLTHAELRIIDVLYRYRGTPVPRHRIGAELGHAPGSSHNSLEAAISRLRRKIRAADAGADLIKSVSGVGYCLHPDVA
jgi:two-component system phosphate regulon response regulator OmpR